MVSILSVDLFFIDMLGLLRGHQIPTGADQARGNKIEDLPEGRDFSGPGVVSLVSLQTLSQASTEEADSFFTVRTCQSRNTGLAFEPSSPIGLFDPSRLKAKLRWAEPPKR